MIWLKPSNEIAKLVVNFGNSEQTSEPIRQKLCETLCNPFSKFKMHNGFLKVQFKERYFVGSSLIFNKYTPKTAWLWLY